MKFGIQMGYGLQQAAIDLTRKWKGGVVVVSPRMFQVRSAASVEESLAKYCVRVSKSADEVFLDPMLYVSKDLLRPIASTDYASSVVANGKDGYLQAARSVLRLNCTCGTTAAILPSWTLDSPDENWSMFQRRVSECAESSSMQKPLYLTLALTADFLKRDGCIDWVLNEAEHWGGEGVFLALEHPNNEYLSDQPLWILNVLCLTAALKRMGKRVMLGYGSHQMLIASLAKCDYLCCGNFLNVRRFRAEDFKSHVDNTRSRRAKWYYVPQALSEYKLPTLDLAYAMGILRQLQSPFDDEYDSMLFSDVMPSSTAYDEGLSFRHYLHSLHGQCAQLSVDSYDETLAACQMLIRTADLLIGRLRAVGVHDAQRNFADASQACGQAMSAFNVKMGFVMRQIWDKI